VQRSSRMVVVFHWLDQTAQLLLISFVLATFGFSIDSLPPIIANPNHIAAGVLRDGVLTLQLEIAKREWHPEADDGMALSVQRFAPGTEYPRCAHHCARPRKALTFSDTNLPR
jgi:hypothetical protein